ncbi:hypothetical protein HV079_15795 [Citrobacter freundii]|uniref:hypothetical protein n=1 Tax=Citrobacter freundii TaxID=546 RepID=UPI0015E98469|nr:hypothetical protein [Citrobacter freundii]QLZ60521.1 hypothetical protein HV079_15795 [Citrobacter freundii]
MTERNLLVLTAEQIKALAEFAESEGQPSYTIAHTTIPAFEADDESIVPEYTGLVAFSDSEEHGVLQLD